MNTKLQDDQLQRVLRCNESPISIWNASSLLKQKQQNPQQFASLSNIIDKLGEASAKAQQLPQVITTCSKLLVDTHELYIYCHENKPVGILKVGEKKLFYMNERAKYLELKPLCVLDFFVSENVQRQGIGKALFEFMLQKIAYDRPSPKLLSFLAKHYNLKDYIPQANNFVFFRAFFNQQQELQDENVVAHNHPPRQSVSPSVASNQQQQRHRSRSLGPLQIIEDSAASSVSKNTKSPCSPVIQQQQQQQQQENVQYNPITCNYETVTASPSHKVARFATMYAHQQKRMQSQIAEEKLPQRSSRNEAARQQPF